MLNDFLKNELKLNRNSGTYLFYGESDEMLMEVAISFAKAICCKEQDYCDSCSICRKIDNRLYSDLNIISSPKIDDIRDMEQKTYSSSHEGGKKIFIIESVETLKKESANAMLKLIEEPTDNNIFILLTKKLSILPTIKSRSIFVKIDKLSEKDLEVSKEIYDFFYGNSYDISRYKKTEIDLSETKNYKDIALYIKEFENEDSIENKINLNKSLINFFNNKDIMNTLDRIFFAEEIARATSDRKDIEKLISYFIFLARNNKNIDKLLEMKKKLRFPINIKLFLINFFMIV